MTSRFAVCVILIPTNSRELKITPKQQIKPCPQGDDWLMPVTKQMTHDGHNGLLALLSGVTGFFAGKIASLFGFMILPENVWIVQLMVGAGVTLFCFGVGKSVDIYYQYYRRKDKD